MFEGLFENTATEEAIKGKTVSSVKHSRSNRGDLIRLFGGIENLPSSIMKAKKVAVTESEDPNAAKRGYDDTAPGIEKARDKSLPKSLRSAFNISGSGCGAGALSRFPQNIGRAVVLLYSNPKSLIFDPFAGHNSRMELSVKCGRNYIGCDISAEFMRTNRIRAKQLEVLYPNQSIQLIEGDSRKIPLESDIADFTLTSPPYWDIEFYGDEEKQLGKSQTYQEFLKGMFKVIKENFRILKSGSYAVYFINDFRKKGKMYFYHMDIQQLGKKVGFIAHDILIVDLGKSIRDAFTNQIISTRILPKRHEYGIVFKKP
jgi:DNA modification methylase